MSYNISSETINYTVEVNTGTVALPTWTAIGGIQEFTPPSREGTTADGTSADEGGWMRTEVTQRNFNAELTVLRRSTTDPGDTFTLDPGQAALDTAASSLMEDAMVQLRWYGATYEDPDAAQCDFVVVSAEPSNTGLTDLAGRTYTLESQTAPTTLPYPVT